MFKELKELLKQKLPIVLSVSGILFLLGSLFKVEDITKFKITPLSSLYWSSFFVGIVLLVVSIALTILQLKSSKSKVEQTKYQTGEPQKFYCQWSLGTKEYLESLELGELPDGIVVGKRLIESSESQTKYEVRGFHKGAFYWLEYHLDSGAGGGTLLLHEFTSGKLNGVIVAADCDTGKLRSYQNRWLLYEERMNYKPSWQVKIGEV